MFLTVAEIKLNTGGGCQTTQHFKTRNFNVGKIVEVEELDAETSRLILEDKEKVLVAHRCSDILEDILLNELLI